jgi:hypothetical protein
MKKVWKWVIGIVIVLVVVAALVGGAFLLRNHFANVVRIAQSGQRGVQVPGYGDGQRFPGMRPFGNDGWGRYGMHMRGPGMMGFGGHMLFGGLIRGLLCLGFLALFVLGIIWLVRRLRKPVSTSSAVAPVAGSVTPAAEVAAPIVEPVVPVVAVAAVHPCPKCGEPVQDGWKHCPNCGKKQK